MCHPALYPPALCPPLHLQLGSVPCSLPGPGNAYPGELNQGLLEQDGAVPLGTDSWVAAEPGGAGSAAPCAAGVCWPCPVAQDLCWDSVLLLLCCWGWLPHGAHGCCSSGIDVPRADNSSWESFWAPGCCLQSSQKLSLLSATACSAECAWRWDTNLQLPLTALSELCSLGVGGARLGVPTLPGSLRFTATLECAAGLQLLRAARGIDTNSATRAGAAPWHGGQDPPPCQPGGPHGRSLPLELLLPAVP